MQHCVVSCVLSASATPVGILAGTALSCWFLYLVCLWCSRAVMDENEEFELEYQDELELLDELPPAEDELYVPVAGAAHSTQVDKAPATLLDTLSSPQLSQISQILQDDTHAGGGPVNRRLFSTPKAFQRGSSTPLHKLTNKPSQLAPIQEVLDGTPPAKLPAADPLEQLQTIGVHSKRRRLERDLFGDIDDLYGNESYEDPVVKKARLDELRDLEDIQRILEQRRNREASNNVKRDNLSRLQELIAFKRRNLATAIPAWPFVPLNRSDNERIYVRFHSEDYEKRELERVSSAFHHGSLLGDRKQQVWAGANEIVLRRTSIEQSQQAASTAVVPAAPLAGGERLWVEKYKPRKYIDLLSDETTNRSLLYWLKMWDKVVFGKEFKPKQEHDHTNASSLNSFNKRTGKFESTGGWKPRKAKQTLNTNVDELGRPVQKVALLCGPPGLGKTTLAQTIARHAGYSVREINASDDRSPEAFKLALENGTQMSAVLNEDGRPNCIILDEIDGAPRQSIEFLVKFVTDNAAGKAPRKTGGGKAPRNILKRPIICICNDLYDAALRSLRQIAFVVSFPPINSSRLADRLLEIAQRERLKTNLGAMIALADKSGNDVRSCISTMQFFNAQKKTLLLHDVLNHNLGQKDRHQGLFDIWNAVFRIQRPKNQLDTKSADSAEPQVTLTDMSVGTRVRHVLDVVHSAGDYERLTQGVYENYLQQRQPDPDMNAIVVAAQWFCFTDTLQRQIGQQQNYTVYPYLQFGFAQWHLLFASLVPTRLNFPMRGYEFNQKSQTQRNIFQALRRGITTSAIGIGQGSAVLVETVPYLKRILSPTLRSVAVQLLSPKEQYDLKHAVEIMADLGLSYNEIKSADGAYVFQLEPDLDLLAHYPGTQGLTLNYFSRQLIARQVELERIRRAQPKSSEPPPPAAAAAANGKSRATKMTPPKSLPNHLQRLQPKRIDAKASGGRPAKDTVAKDFFGRIKQKSANGADGGHAVNDPIVKSPIWYRYKEGFNNAVRKDVRMNELL